MSNTARYLWGMDLSLKNTGVTIYNLDTKEFVYIGSFNTEKIYATKENKGRYLNGVKLKKIVDWLKELNHKYPPTHIVIERGFSRFNTETQVIFRVHGVVNCLFWQIPQEYYAVKTVKAAIYKGDATKAQVAKVIQNNFVDIEFANDDESDSFAVALTYLISNGLIEFEKPIVDKPKPKKKSSTPKSSKNTKGTDLVELTMTLNQL